MHSYDAWENTPQTNPTGRRCPPTIGSPSLRITLNIDGLPRPAPASVEKDLGGTCPSTVHLSPAHDSRKGLDRLFCAVVGQLMNVRVLLCCSQRRSPSTVVGRKSPVDRQEQTAPAESLAGH